ncbi:hypothetical protein LTR37_016958 [Vermiconidia calcicola]|uniref:Uncharacterized protein n=1 Tax=Vermiconidia calcicola TaxID=1690605 RepID=A0ACC3MLC1_9PEZI|nr:hypothetical protein LTR37_016958 [Vermiconidia calcicola]
MAWTGSLFLDNDSSLGDLSLSGKCGQGLPFPFSDVDSLQLLSVVEVSRIPLHLMVGSPCTVTACQPEIQNWFTNILLGQTPEDDGNSDRWWETARPDSPLGILVGVKHSKNAASLLGPCITELLFYASRDVTAYGTPPTPPTSSPAENGIPPYGQPREQTLNVNAIALSSHLLHCPQDAEPTPPASPLPEDESIDAIFLPQAALATSEIINEPPVRKRRSAADAFDEASERRKKARRKGGEGVAAAAAAPTPDSQMPSLKHRRSVSTNQPVPLQTRPLSRSPSIASSRPPTAATAQPKPSALSRVESVTGQMDGSNVEAKNKDMISRVVMAGMRLHGLSQSKSRKSRAGSSAPSPVVEPTFDEFEAERKRDEEYKLIYHQVFKGSCFAFRATMGAQSLQPFSEAVRDVVDKLLAMFCNDPLTDGVTGSLDKLTPGGRKAFGADNGKEQKSPFRAFEDAKVSSMSPNARRRPEHGVT